MRIIFCSEPFTPDKPDSLYQPEIQEVTKIGLPFELINFEALVDDDNAQAAVKRIRRSETIENAIYRGWMLTPLQYARLFGALAQRGLSLINTPEQYKHCHYLPESYPIIKDHTPKTVFIPYDGSIDFDQVIKALALFDSKPLILKDYVKSRKHEWYEACYIPSASDREAVQRVTTRFLELQDNQFNGGLALREFIEFEALTTHSKSGMPLTKEFRLFFFEGQLLYSIQYWEQGDYGGIEPPLDTFNDVARSVKSRFFTMDIAKRTNGEWMIIELGDAQVAGLPESACVGSFYHALKKRLVALGLG